MHFLTDRFETLKGLRKTWLLIAIAVLVGVIGDYDSLVSQLVPAPYAERFPKFYVVVGMIGSFLGLQGWLWICVILFVFFLFEHEHRERIDKPSLTPVFLLFIGGVFAFSAALQAGKETVDQKARTDLEEIRKQVKSLPSPEPALATISAQVARLTASQKKDEQSIKDASAKNAEEIKNGEDRARSGFFEYLSYLKKKTLLSKAEDALKKFPIAMKQTHDLYCSTLDLGPLGNLSQNDMMMPFQYRYDSHLSPLQVLLVEILPDAADGIAPPSGIEKAKQDYISAVRSKSNREQITQLRYADDCGKLDDSLSSMSTKLSSKIANLTSLINGYETQNVLK